jgi:SAM-dependent methyltransferase
LKRFDPVTRWSIEFLSSKEVLREEAFGITREAKTVDFPLRLLRYWFGYHLMVQEWNRIGHPLDVAEIGVHTGQMRQFCDLAFSREYPNIGKHFYNRWLAVDVKLLREPLEKAGYTEFQKANLEDSGFALEGIFDTAVCLHVFEHLFEPEKAMKKLADGLRPGGSIIGGFPSIPDFLVAVRQSHLRKVAKPFGHVSKFSPARVRRMAAGLGMTVEFCNGAFFARKKGSLLENSSLWLRFNLLWGAIFPWWPGEIYWLARKPTK